MFCSGMVTGGFSVYLPYLREEYGSSNTQISLLLTVRCVASTLAMLAVERYYQRFSLRLGSTLAILMLAAGFFSFAAIPAYWGGCVGFILLGAAYGFGAMVPVSLLIRRWFDGGQGFALGICTTGSGLATVLITPLLASLLERHSVCAVFSLEGIGTMAIAALIFLMVRGAPKPDGKVGCPEGGEASRDAGSGEAFAGPGFWWMALAVMILGSAAGNGPAYFAIRFQERGFSPTLSAYAISTCGGLLMIGKCVYGLLTDRWGARRTNALFLVTLGAGMAVCALLPEGSAWMMFLGAALVGIGFPPATVGLTVWAMDLAPREQQEATMERFQTFYVVGNLFTSFLPGLLADWSGSYALTYGIYAVSSLVILVIVQRQYALRRVGEETGAF
nr:MFS transporter [Dysosmobacter acutus]